MKNSWGIVYSITILISILISGCITIIEDQPTDKAPTTESTCDQLAQELDNNLGKGIAGINGLIVGGTLISISPAQYFDYNRNYPADYIYTLTFQGQTKKAEFKFYTPTETTVPLTEGKFYQFELLKAYGEVTSMGPHNSMFSSNEIRQIFQPIDC